MKIAFSGSLVANVILAIILVYSIIDTGISLDHCRMENQSNQHILGDALKIVRNLGTGISTEKLKELETAMASSGVLVNSRNNGVEIGGFEFI